MARQSRSQGVTKRCSKCREEKPRTEFKQERRRPGGLASICRKCHAARQSVRDVVGSLQADDTEKRRLAEIRAKLDSDFAALNAEDFDVSIGNVPETGADKARRAAAAKEKRQEFNRAMGEHAQALRGAATAAARGDGDVLDNMPAEAGTYIGKLAEQERRFGNRRTARSISLAEAHEALSIRRFKEAAREYLSGKIQPVGYATKKRDKPVKRSVCALLSDLHFGSDLSALDSPVPYRAIEEARRFEYVLRQVLDYKPQYRADSRAVLMFNGDIIEGLLHDLRDGAPLTEQKVIAWRLMAPFVGQVAAAYPEVLIVCQPGNHGRCKVRHPGRATSRKWDGHEFEIYWALREMSSQLANVTWQIDFRAVSTIDLHGAWFGLTHGDTEVKLGDPDTRSTQNAQAFDRINARRIYGVEFAAWGVGHFHKPRYQPRNPRVLWNGALVPPNGYARGEGYIGEPQGQWLWEAVAGYPVGDARFIEVGEAQDHDERLGSLIKPFRFSD